MIATSKPADRNVRVRVQRQDSPSSQPHWEEFDVIIERGANVISCLQGIAGNPKTIDGRQSAPITYDAACLEEVCGSCTMIINGRVRQACSALVDECAPRDGDEIVLEPMGKFPVIRDLVVNRERMFHALRRLRAWVPIDGTYDLGPGPRSTPEDQHTRYKLSECMSCGCCVEACPQYQREDAPAEWDTAFVGPAAISQVRLFNDHGTGGVLADLRLDVLMGPGGIGDCGNAQNCVKVCPKEIPLTESIASIGRSTTKRAFRKFFAGK